MIRHEIDQLFLRMKSGYLFFEKPHINFSSTRSMCNCGNRLNILKTDEKLISTLEVGEFIARETQKICKHCKQIYCSAELRALTPNKGKFGFDVIEFIGKSLFLLCHNESEIQAQLAVKNIPISFNEIGFLGKRFIVYLMLAHKECQEQLKQYMYSKGGYILHMDGTCEGDSPHLFRCIDEISNIVLGNRKMLTEDSLYIIPFLQSLKKAYGIP